MAYTTSKTYTQTGSSNKAFTITFPFLESTDVTVQLGGVTKTVGTHYTILGSTITFEDGVLGSGSNTIGIIRKTDLCSMDPVFQTGASIRAQDLNKLKRRVLFAAQEFRSAEAVGSDDLTWGSKNHINAADNSNWTINSNVVANTHMTANSIDSDQYVDGSIDNVHLANLSVSTGKIQDDAVTADKLANSINTEIAANTAKVTNATHTGEVTGATALTITSNIVDEDNLKVDNGPTNDHVLTAKSSASGGLTWAAIPTSGLYTSYAILKDIKSSGTNGGTLDDGDWRDRDLNNEVDPDGIVTLSNDEFTLGTGTYLLKWTAPGHDVINHNTRIYNITDSTTPDELVGIGASSNQTHESITHSVGVGRITISGNKTFKLQHRCSGNEGSGDGMGAAKGWGPEVYAIVEIYKEG